MCFNIEERKQKPKERERKMRKENEKGKLYSKTKREYGIHHLNQLVNIYSIPLT
jgi:hypothetical protein